MKNTIGYKTIDSYTSIVILSYSKLLNTIKTAFDTSEGIKGEKETSLHRYFNPLLNRYDLYFIRNQKAYYLNDFTWN